VKNWKAVWLSLALLCGMASARELLVNGNFEDPARTTWRWDTFGVANDTGDCHLWQSYYYDPDLDREVCVHKTLHQWAMLSQTVEIPSTNLNFSASAKFFAKTERPDTGYYACANVILSYMDVNDSLLGETRIYVHTGGCDWASTPVLHLIDAPDSTHWHNYAFNVNDELDNLTGVSRSDVTKIRVGVWTYVRNNC
jgi:hypothetical protein